MFLVLRVVRLGDGGNCPPFPPLKDWVIFLNAECTHLVRRQRSVLNHQALHLAPHAAPLAAE